MSEGYNIDDSIGNVIHTSEDVMKCYNCGEAIEVGGKIVYVLGDSHSSKCENCDITHSVFILHNAHLVCPDNNDKKEPSR